MHHLRLLKYLIVALIILYPTLASASAPVITADNQYYDFETGLYILDGNVSVQTKHGLVQAQKARVSMTALEVFAEGGITFSQDELCLSGGDTIFVTGKEHRLVIEGNIRLQSSTVDLTCARADFNWKTKNATLSNVSFVENGEAKYVDEAVYNVRNKMLQY